MSNDVTSIHWYDGQLVSGSRLSLPLQDPALLYGATVFTTLRIYENRLDHPWTAWQAHVTRTQRSLQAFGWSAPDWDRLQ
ncbi:MAG: 4-amino-4-deoxychorismate lyase, partial [Cyanobacteria bacterium J06636_16]